MAQPPREKGGKVVFIGNIPYGVSEEQICEIFGRVGQVVSFRLVYDKETGRPKGFGFLEYTDVDAAASAVRNLNEFEIMGRTLRVDYSNDNSGGGQRTQAQDHDGGRAPPPGLNAAAGQTNGSAELPPLPPGTEVPAGLTAPDAISQTVSKIPVPQLLEIISQMKTMALNEPQKATALLTSAPQLSYAVFQALLLLGLVDANVIGSLVQHAAAQPPAQQTQMQQPVYPQQQPPPVQYAPPPPPPPPGQTQPLPQAFNAAPPPAPYQGYNPTPPVQQPAYQPPPPPQQQQQQQQQQPPAPAGATPDQAALIQQILTMTQDQIMSQPEPARSTIIQLRAQYGAPVS